MHVLDHVNKDKDKIWKIGERVLPLHFFPSPRKRKRTTTHNDEVCVPDKLYPSYTPVISIWMRKSNLQSILPQVKL